MNPDDSAQVGVAFENTGASDFVLNLGMLLANGRSMFPTAVRLLVTDPAGNTQELAFRTPPAIAGRLDDFTVALPAGAIYMLRAPLTRYSIPGQFQLALGKGRHRIAARFEGRGAQFGNLDMTAVALLNFWKGTVNSTAVEFDVGKPDLPRQEGALHPLGPGGAADVHQQRRTSAERFKTLTTSR